MKMNFNLILNFFTKYYKHVGILFLLLFALYWLIFISIPSVKISQNAVHEIKKLNNEISILKSEQAILYTKIDKYQEQLKGLDSNISKINDTKNKISGEYKEKINAARSFDYKQLVTFLSERYPKSGIY